MRGLYYGWLLVLTLGATETVTWGVLYYSFTVFLPAMEADLGWSRGATSGAFSLALLVAGLAAIPVGRWLDARGARVLMTAGSAAGALLVLAWSRVATLTQFYVLWALIGLAMAAVLYEPAFAVVTTWFVRRRARALAITTLMAGFASTIFLPLTAWLIGAQGWRMALVTLAAILAATTILPHALLLRRRPEDLGLRPDGDPPGPPRPVARLGPRAISAGAALREPSFRWLVAAFCLNAVVVIAVQVHLVAYLQDRGASRTFAASAAGLIGATQVLGRLLLGALGEQVPLRPSAAAALGVQPAALIALLLVPGTFGLATFIVLFGAANGARTLIRPAYVAHLYGSARYATVAGVLASFVVVAQALAPVAAGVAYDALGRYEPLLWALVGLATLAALAVLQARPTATLTGVEPATEDEVTPAHL